LRGLESPKMIRSPVQFDYVAGNGMREIHVVDFLP